MSQIQYFIATPLTHRDGHLMIGARGPDRDVQKDQFVDCLKEHYGLLGLQGWKRKATADKHLASRQRYFTNPCFIVAIDIDTDEVTVYKDEQPHKENLRAKAKQLAERSQIDHGVWEKIVGSMEA